MCLSAQNEAAWQRWVVVFGFSGTSSGIVERVLHEFQQFGDIDSYSVRTNDGNWVFIRYNSPLDASRAAQHNGSCLGTSNQMIGVIRLCSGDSTHKYRVLLQQTLSSSGGSHADFEGGDMSARSTLLAAAAVGPNTPGGSGREGGRRRDDLRESSALRHRREALGSTAYR